MSGGFWVVLVLAAAVLVAVVTLLRTTTRSQRLRDTLEEERENASDYQRTVAEVLAQKPSASADAARKRLLARPERKP